MARAKTATRPFPANLPQHFQYLTEAQTRDVLEWFISLPLKELRERQALVAEQIGWCYDDQYYTRDGEAGTHIRGGMQNLYVQQKHLEMAIQIQHFEGGVLTDEQVSYLMWYQAEVAKQPLKPHVELPAWLT